MSIVTELEPPDDEFALSETLRTNPDAEFEIERASHTGSTG
ncbi:hypothetical protein [Natrononativus amylolyticus]|nr:hypothetical protein [Natrononativus amylolyticus]